MNLDVLVSSIKNIDASLKQEANKAVNRLLTIRNWLIGYYIVEYEQKGEDRAKYGDGLLEILSDSLQVKGLSVTALRTNRLFYIQYTNIRQTLSAELQNNVIGIHQTPSAELQNNVMGIVQTLSAQLGIGEDQAGIGPYESLLNERIINKLSFSHINLLLPIEQAQKRAFYAIEAIKGTWSVRELKRQINSLLYERSGISKKPEQLLEILNETVEVLPQTFVKDIYTFEFLGLPAKDAVEEDDLETALLDHLQNFLLEMGHGFCLEARQKRILIGDEYFFIDIVFYHRVLKCHVLIELKVEEFTHNNAGQLNTYLNYYKKEVQRADDNPPIGILLVTNKNETLVEYATAGMDEQLFVRKYKLELPDKAELESFLRQELRNL